MVQLSLKAETRASEHNYRASSHFKGQSALETMAMVGILLAFLVPLAILFLSSAGLRSQDLSLIQGKVLAQRISDEAGFVWYQGAGAKKVVLVQYPERLLNISFQDRQVVITLEGMRGGINQVVALTPSNMADAILPNGAHDARRSITMQHGGRYVNPGIAAIVFYNNGTAVNVFREAIYDKYA